MFRFEHPEFLWLLVLVPVILVMYAGLFLWQKKQLKAFSNPALLGRLVGGWAPQRKWLKAGLFAMSIGLLIIALANPQWGSKREKVEAKAADIMIALDISNSMMAEDVAPNRLARSQRIIERIIDQIKGERIGLILFAGNAYLQSPLTNDYGAVIMFLKGASPDQATTQGTDIGAVIDLAEKSFDPQNKSNKVLIIITDGEDHEEAALEKAKEAAQDGLVIFTVAVGTPAGSFIPKNYGLREDYLRDAEGKPVRSIVNTELLEELAQQGNGLFFTYQDDETMARAMQNRIDKLDKQQVEQRSFSEYESYFQPFLLIALLLLTLQWWLPNAVWRKKEKSSWI